MDLVVTAPSGEAVLYEDRKRHLWLLSVLYPLQPFAGIALHAATGQEAWLLLPIVVAYVAFPLLDSLIGEDRDNPPEYAVRELEADPYYRRLTWIVVPLHFAALIGSAWWAGTQVQTAWAWLALAAVAGMTSGLAINTGHELGHRQSRFERLLARVVLAIPGYGHFWIEHNRGHHRDVATPGDPASARMGESIYRFALREIPGAFVRAWRLEAERLGYRGYRTWSPRNHILQSLAVTIVLQGALVIAFGPWMLLFLCLHNAFAWWQLTSANYIEHYGLLRRRQADGRYERCQPWHSWNSNHLLSNLVLFHLERHSDHHAHPQRRYQSLRHLDGVPALPSGYPGCYLLAWVPWLWYRVMDPKLLALPEVAGDLDRVNLDPVAGPALRARYAPRRAPTMVTGDRRG